ncbi:PEP-CTERM sorting domain-containing protein [Horticoccus luteus]|uniref:PEP-CTERM sorting domain-containing protein n=2 Tax=Horticoccus luteus TaxID=2862869 RepID=A0A8F9TXT2_9BACT|nr:PEP-CTERM sorting domain-containing protein [Horticoccus luteus]
MPSPPFMLPTSFSFRASLLLCLLAVSASAQTVLNYTATGGLISGSLNGTAFTDATWTATATADPATRVYTGGEVPEWDIDALVSLTIADASNTFTVSLTGWTIFSIDYTAYFGEAHGASGFYSDAGAIYIDSANGFLSLDGPNGFTGTSGFDDQGHSPYATSGGDLIIANSSNTQGGAFSVSAASPIPEPATWSALVGASVLGLAFHLRRRRLRRA